MAQTGLDLVVGGSAEQDVDLARWGIAILPSNDK
jgi:hypothetical protein